MDRNKVVLVDLNDNAIGEMDKIEAHQKGVLHRAFSIFLFNTCCSHPQWDDDIKESAQERLRYETGMYCYLNKSFSFIYHTSVENNLIEHEYDHVFVGYTDMQPRPNRRGVQHFTWISPDSLQEQVQRQPDIFTFWFKFIFRNPSFTLSGKWNTNRYSEV